MDRKTPLGEILILDDAEAVRSLVVQFLRDGGYRADAVSTARDLLKRLSESERAPDAVLLDLQLDGDLSISETYQQLRLTYPDITFPHEEVLDDLCMDDDDQVSGNYLLPMIKTIYPSTQVIILTGAWEGIEDEDYLRKWGSYVTVQKAAPDEAFQGATTVYNLDQELLDFLRRGLTEKKRS